jgi:ABC-type phosphate transport system ATPase subunit
MLHNPCLLEKVFFWAFKTLLSPFGIGKKTFLSTLNVMISQTVRNEYTRFGGHVDIEISYKILQLEILNEALILLNSPCF